MPCHRCQGKTKNNLRCKLKISCNLGCEKFCYHHAYAHTPKTSCKDEKPNTIAVIGNGVVVKPSTLPGAGLGLFASRPFKKNEIITEYVGRIISKTEAVHITHADPARATHFCALSLNHSVIDGLRTPVVGMGGASFANDSNKHPPYNSRFYTTEKPMPKLPDHRTGNLELKRLFLKAKQNIEANDEIFVDYQNQTRKRMGI